MNISKFLSFTASEFHCDQTLLTSETPIRELPNWNSLNALVFISEIKREFGVILSSKDLTKVVTLQDLYDLIQHRN